MILWRLCGYTDPEGEIEAGEVVCSIERAEDGYRLLIEHDGEIQTHESHASVETARGRADMIKRTLLDQGWVPTSEQA